MAPEMFHLSPTTLPSTPPNTPTKSSQHVATTGEEMGASASMLSDMWTKMGPSQPPGGVAHPAYPARGGPALTRKQQDYSQQKMSTIISPEAQSYLDQIRLEFVNQPNIFDTFRSFLRDFYNQAIDFPGLTSRVSELFAGHPNLIQGLNQFLPPSYQVESGASNDPNTICATDRPVARNALTPTRTEQSSGINAVTPQQPDAAQATAAAAKDAESVDFSTMMVQCSTSLSVPQRLAISIQPPELTRPGIELYPPIEVRLLQPEDMLNVWAEATLLSGGTDVTYQLGGELIQSPIDGTFRFSGLTAYEGIYCIRINLYQLDFDSCRVSQVGCVDSNDIIIGPRPDFMAICRSIGDVTTAQDSVAQPLLCQTVDANNCIDDHTGHFSNLKIHASSSVIIMGQIPYSKYMVFKPVSDFMLETADLEHGFYNFGNGLFRDEDGVWYDDGEIEWAEGLDESILFGEDGEMYRKVTDGVDMAAKEEHHMRRSKWDKEKAWARRYNKENKGLMAKLNLREGGLGGGFKEYKLLNKELKDFRTYRYNSPDRTPTSPPAARAVLAPSQPYVLAHSEGQASVPSYSGICNF
ncbi:hypothetical protein V500_00878 [Pseudogymnoascus sp. VKM F-4518 (FW-2643)]|nr:hypothetical protein V500_00878 [Pseudogymnoascus sp. VKM F-4518 (FW-2643)]